MFFLLLSSFFVLKFTRGLFWNNCSGKREGILWEPRIKIMPGRDQRHRYRQEMESVKKLKPHSVGKTELVFFFFKSPVEIYVQKELKYKPG